MTEYEYRRKIPEGVVGVDPEEGVTVDLPEDAVGITLRSFSDDIWVRYLVPVEEQEVATDGGTSRPSTIVGDPSDSAESRPVEISDCEVGDDVVIEPEPSVETDAPDEIRAEVTRAEESTHKMAGDSRERVVGETLEVNAEDGETYVRKGTGTVFVIQERRTRAGVQDFHCAIAFDSSLRLEGGEEA